MVISIIIVNYNTFKITCDCLDSIFKSQTSRSFEVILVDNNSKDEDPSLFLQRFPTINLIVNKSNMGFGAANNIGMKAARGRYILLLNSDTIIRSDTLEKCSAFVESLVAEKNNVGLIGCKLLNPDNSLQPSVFPYLKNNLFIFLKTSNPLMSLMARVTNTDKHISFDYNKAQPVGDVSGAFMFFKTEVCKDTGYFDTDFFMFCEDTEWCRERISRRCAIYYYPETSVVHLGGQSAPNDLMYLQSKLSLSLIWYKKGWLNYLGYIFITYVNLVCNILVLPFVKSQTRDALSKAILAAAKICPYLFIDIPKFGKAPNSRTEKLVYRPAAKAMGLP